MMYRPVPKQYLGDSVYAEDMGWAIKLTTNNGLSDSNTIYLEMEVYAGLVQFRKLIAENQATAFMCGRCKKVIVKEEDELCPECITTMAEYLLDADRDKADKPGG